MTYEKGLHYFKNLFQVRSMNNWEIDLYHAGDIHLCIYTYFNKSDA